MEPDLEGIPIPEGGNRKFYLGFQGYRDTFIRHKMVAKVLTGCASDAYNEEVLAGTVYTSAKYQKTALPINSFGKTGTLAQTDCITEIVLTDYREEELREIDPRLVILAPFTVSPKVDNDKLLQLGRDWKRKLEQCYPKESQKKCFKCDRSIHTEPI